jgi:catechol 2,3-dioxygenase-like lactoylglutathione lyase family enzyme
MATRKPAAPSSLTFNHAMVYSGDVEASLRFYTEALGLKPLDLMLPYYARLRSPKGNATIALHKVEPGADLPLGGIRLYFETPQLAAAVKRVTRAGYAVKGPPKKMPWGWTHVYLDDPDGHEISLYWSAGLRTKKAAQRP